jgi:hypothetical protein
MILPGFKKKCRRGGLCGYKWFKKILLQIFNVLVTEKKPHARKAWSHEVLLQSVSEDDRPVTMLSLTGLEINLRFGSTLRVSASPQATATLP